VADFRYLEMHQQIPTKLPLLIYFFQASLLEQKYKDKDYNFEVQFTEILSLLEDVAIKYYDSFRVTYGDLDQTPELKTILMAPNPDAPDGVLIWDFVNISRHYPKQPFSLFQQNAVEFIEQSPAIHKHIDQFISDFQQKKTVGIMLSQTVPEKQTGDVLTVTAKNWNALITQQTEKFFLLEIFITSCPYCQQLEPEYKKLASFYRKGEYFPEIVFGAFNYYENDFPIFSTYQLEEFPTLLLFPPKPMSAESLGEGKSVVIYNKTYPYKVSSELTALDLLRELRIVLESTGSEPADDVVDSLEEIGHSIQ